MNGKPIRDYRRENGISQSQFGAMLTPAVDQTTVSGWETGRRSFADQAMKVSRIIGVPLEELFSSEDCAA